MSVVDRNPPRGLIPAVGKAVRRPAGSFPGRMDQEAMRIIRKCGFIYRELNGKPWVTSGENISVERFERLLELGLIIPKGDSLFGAPSQTYVPKEESKNVQASIKRTPYSHRADREA